MKPQTLQPPHWPLKFLRFFLKKEYLEEIEGDMEEFFYENTERFSVGKAKRIYTWEMIKLLRPNLIKNFEFVNKIIQYSMIKNYFKVSVRGLLKSPVNSFINIFGLAAAIGFCIFFYAFVVYTFKRDQFHENKDVVFLTTFTASREGALRQYGLSPRPLGELLKQDFPQVTKVCRVEDRNVIVKHGDNIFNERIRFVDPTFLDMFTFPLKWGVSTSLTDLNSVVISEPMAEKYFGDENPIGQSILVKFTSENGKEFKITGVAKKFPSSRSFDFHFLVNFDNLRTAQPGFDFHDWSAFHQATFIQVAQPSDITMVEVGMSKYKRLQNEAVEKDWAIASFQFEPLATTHIKTDEIREDVFREGTHSNLTSIKFLSGICTLMLLLACFNYINIAISTSVKRLKELGVRKTIGATRRLVIVQFLSENIVVTFFAMLFGILLGWLVVIPWFEGLWHFSMEFSLNDPRLWMYLPVIMLITAIASGIYPAIYISRFQTVTILKGSVRFGQKNPITKIFLGFQLVLACMFITSAIVFTMNGDYLANRSWGYSNRDVLYTAVADESAFQQLNDVMQRNPKVLSISGSAQHIGKTHQTTVLHFPDKDFEADRLAVSPSYFKTMGIELAEGREFKDFDGSDKNAVVVNETMVKNLSWSNPLGQQFRIDSITYEVVGVAKDFHSYSFFSLLKPAFFTVADKKDFKFIALKVNREHEQSAFEDLKKSWVTLYPEIPFNGGYQEDVWGNYYEQMGIHGHVWRVFATVAVILAMLGLYGLVAINVSGRVREFSIRKILGADYKNISNNIFKQYYGLVTVSLFVGGPLSFFFIKSVLDFVYDYHMPLTIWVVVIAASLLVAVVVITVATQIIKVFKSNPVEGLKVE
ncbi:MAG TPA: ABC transporter permease [Cyclobacteriaceae bacterium]|nr:ABC transporter permease [Cyclobacteriaceae bacterium]HRF32406.1 ABC transporter permease [Cyclobacteriaceae bacterium]